MTARLVRCRVLRDGRPIEHGELSVHVDLEEGDPDEVLKGALRNAARRDGYMPIGMYVLQLFDNYDDVITTYALSE